VLSIFDLHQPVDYKAAMDFALKPQPGAFKNNLLRVQPDILPPGSVRIGACSINEEPYTDFDAGSRFKLPDTKEQVKVKVQIIPNQ